MYSDFINVLEENYLLKDYIRVLEDAILAHAQKTRAIGHSVIDEELWETAGLIIYSDEDKERKDKEALRMETEAQREAEGYI